MATTNRQQSDTTPTADIEVTFSRQGQRIAADQRHQRRDEETAELQERDGIRDRGRRGSGRRRHEPARGRRVKNVDLRLVGELEY